MGTPKTVIFIGAKMFLCDISYLQLAWRLNRVEQGKTLKCNYYKKLSHCILFVLQV